MLASPLIYSGQLSREDHELRLAHLSGNSELRYIHLCSSLILLDPDFKIFSQLVGKDCNVCILNIYSWLDAPTTIYEIAVFSIKFKLESYELFFSILLKEYISVILSL